MTRLLSVCASPVEGSSTEILLRRIASAISVDLKTRVSHEFIRLADLDITPCRSCGESPAPGYCFIDDPMTALYRSLERCDCLLFGSPIYFDSVAAPAKAFIDRCNCIRPYNFGRREGEHHFVDRPAKKRPGAIILVGSEKAWFEGARRCVAGFFKWVGVENEGVIMHQSGDVERIGDVIDRAETLAQAEAIGKKLAAVIGRNRARR